MRIPPRSSASSPQVRRRRGHGATPRNITATREAFLEAVETLLRREGLQAMGINAIAKQARRDKALIYKYFGGLEGLFAAFAAHAQLFPELDEMIPPSGKQPQSPLALAKAYASGYIRMMRERPLTLEIMRWELVVHNALTKALSEFRARQTEQFNARMRAPAGVDMAAVTSLIYGGLVYLLLKADGPGNFNGMDLRADKTWSRLEKSIHVILEGIFP